MNKGLKYAIVVVALGMIGYNLVYFRKLSEMQGTAKSFNADAFVDEIWKNKLGEKLAQAVQLTDLINAIQNEKESAWTKYTNALAIGNYRYALVKFKANVVEVNEDDLLIQTNHADSLLTLKMTTEFIYGNAVRDASGLVDVKDFPITSELNAISESFNARIKRETIGPLKQNVKKGDVFEVVGAIELNKEHLAWHGLEIIPVTAKRLN